MKGLLRFAWSSRISNKNHSKTGQNLKGCFDLCRPVGFHTKTIQKQVTIEKVASILFAWVGQLQDLLYLQTFVLCKILVDGRVGMCETFVTCKLLVVQNFWHVRSIGTWFKIWDVQKFREVQSLGRAKVLARSKFGT